MSNLQHGEHFIPVRRAIVIPDNDQRASEQLAKEPYLTKRYNELRQSGNTIEQAWNAIWCMIELEASDIEHILMAFVSLIDEGKLLPHDSMGTTYEKIRAFHYDAFPIADTYVLTKVVGTSQDEK